MKSDQVGVASCGRHNSRSSDCLGLLIPSTLGRIFAFRQRGLRDAYTLRRSPLWPKRYTLGMRFRVLTLLALFLFAHRLCEAALTFSTIDYPGALDTYANGSNASGAIVGGYLPNGYGQTAFLDIGGVFATIPEAMANGINDSGVIVGAVGGNCSSIGGSCSFIYDQAAMSNSKWAVLRLLQPASMIADKSSEPTTMPTMSPTVSSMQMAYSRPSTFPEHVILSSPESTTRGKW